MHEYVKLMIEAVPLPCFLWEKGSKPFECNQKTLEFFRLNSKQEYIDRFFELSPKYQPDGQLSVNFTTQKIQEVVNNGQTVFEWMHCLPGSEPFPVEVTLVKIDYKDNMFVTGYIRDLREQKQMMFENERYNLLLQTVNQTAAVLLDTEVTRFENNLYSSMDMMVRTIGADRVSIWKNNIHNDELCATQLYEWAEGIAPNHDGENTINISYRKNIPDWEKILSSGQCINSMASDMESSSYDFLRAKHVQSFFVAPIFVQADFWGFVEFDDCHRERIFSDQEVSILRSGCLLIGDAFLRKDMTLSLQGALDDAKTASNSKSAFLAHMSHEIRTPMNSVIGFSELALDDEIPSRTRDYLTKILQNSEWLLQIINDILDIAKIESGKMDLENIPFDLHEMFTACQTLIMPKAIEKGLSVYIYAEPIVDKRLFGDPTRLRQVFINLLSNSVKFTDIGSIKMKAAVKSSSAESITMYFEVKDSGIGIKKDQMERIFDSFTQAESGTTRKFGGSGLGLAITKSLVEIMGGTLAVDSTPGVGTKFSFEITFAAVDAGKGNLTEQNIFDDLEKPAFEGEILLCEDNAMNQQVICEHLSRVGLKTIVASNGKEGVDIVESRIKKGEKQFDLIFMDIHMPVMDGLEAAEKIIGFNINIPIIAMTANIMTTDRDNYLSIGMNDCLGKPFTSRELWRCLMKFLKPVTCQKEDTTLRKKADNELHQKMINSFVKSNRGKFKEFKNAIDKGDIKKAHRLVHNLKSNAGHLKKMHLMQVVEEIENLLKGGENIVTPQQMEAFESSLNTAIKELEPLVYEKPVSKTKAAPLDNIASWILLEKLEPLLERGDLDCLSQIESLLAVEGSEDLIEHIKELDFDLALLTLDELKKKM